MSAPHRPLQMGKVKLLRMDGVDHTYPTGEPLHAAEQVWSFFEPYALP